MEESTDPRGLRDLEGRMGVRGLSSWAKVVLALSLLVLLAGGYWFYSSQEQHEQRELADELATIAELKINQISEWRHERMDGAAVVSQDPFFAENVADWLSNPQPAREKAILRRLRSLGERYHYQSVFLLDRDGKVLLTPDGLHDPVGEYLQRAVRSSFVDGEPRIVDLHRDPSGGDPHITVIAPLFLDSRSQGKPLGAVIMVHEAREFLFPLIRSWPTASETAETLLVRREGDEVLFLNDLRHRKDTALKFSVPLSRAESLAVQGVLGERGVVEGIDYRGEEVLAVVEEIPDSPWIIVTKMDTEEAFAAWRLRSGMILALLLVFVVLVGVGALVMSQRNMKVYYRALYRSSAARRAAEDRHSTTLQSIGDGVIVSDREGRVELLNPVAEELTGWMQDEAAGRPLEEIFVIRNEETGEDVESPVARVLREDVVVALANGTLLIARDGTERPITDSGAPVRDEQGVTTGVVLVFSDRTADRERRRAVEENERRLSTLMSNLRGMVYRCQNDRDWTMEFVSVGCRDLTGYPPEALLYNAQVSFGNIVHPDDKHIVWDAVQEALISAGKFEMEYRIVRRDGEVRWVWEQGQGVFGEEGELLALEGFITDISQRRQAQNERERLLSAVEQAGEAIFITDTQGTIEHVNPAFEAVTGYTREEVVGRNPRILKSGKQGDGFYRELWETISGGETWQGRFVNRRKDGTFYSGEATISPVHDGAGNIVNYVAVQRDITHELAMEEQYRQAQKMESVGRLAGGVAHDFNNMLSVILGHAESALEEGCSSEPIRDDLQEIRQAAERSARLTQQLLAFSRMQAVTPKVLDLNETVEGMLMMLRRLAGEDIDLVWSPGREVWPVKIDPVQLNQVLVNLVVNARGAISGVGRVTIVTKNTSIDQDTSGLYADIPSGEYVLLTVSDDGCGMTGHTLANAFEPFFTTKKKDQGTGLGLSSVYGIIRQNGGFINAYSEVGEGSTFLIHLPRSEEDGGQVEGAAEVEQRSRHEVEEGGGETILVVEDEAAILNLARRGLERLGYTVLAAGSPAEALQKAEARSEEIHLVITDVVMPEMNGSDLASRLQSLYPHVKILFMSGYTADVIAHRGIMEEEVHFIAKPFSTRGLAVKVREALQ